MNRRDFLRRLVTGTAGLAAAAHTLDLERLLWVPKPMITVPAMPGLTSDWLAEDVMRMFERNLVLAGRINRRYDAQFPRVGETLTVRLPQRYSRG